MDVKTSPSQCPAILPNRRFWFETRFRLVIHAEDETAIDHNAHVVNAPDGGRCNRGSGFVILIMLAQFVESSVFKAHEYTGKARRRAFSSKSPFRTDCTVASGLPQPPHACHSVDMRPAKRGLPNR